jgi:dienelactone hydrolase
VTEVLLFHHALGPTPGLEAFAGELREAGQTVHAPDLFEGRRFTTIEAGVAHAKEVGFDTVIARGERAAQGLPEQLVYAGFSLGVLPAQWLTQSRPGALGALLFYSCVPVAEFGAWPAGVPVQVHGMADDPIFAREGDLDAARELVAAGSERELFITLGVSSRTGSPCRSIPARSWPRTPGSPPSGWPGPGSASGTSSPPARTWTASSRSPGRPGAS